MYNAGYDLGEKIVLLFAYSPHNTISLPNDDKNIKNICQGSTLVMKIRTRIIAYDLTVTG